MSLSNDFKRSHDPGNVGEQVLRLTIENVHYYYDFRQRMMTAIYRYGNDKAVQVIPFSQLDRETLVEMRDVLVGLGGKPKELPAEAHVVPKQRGLNP